MKSSPIKMIITDLDNTLLRSDKTISEYSADVLKRCQAHGIKVIFATARSIQASSRFTKNISPDIIVAYGGALAVEENHVICRFDISRDLSEALISKCMKTIGINAIYAVHETQALTNNKDDLSHNDYSHYMFSDFSSPPDRGYLKISVKCDVPEIVEGIAELFPMFDMLRYSNENLYRFANRNAVKWNAVKSVVEYCEADISDVVAFGDDFNDVEMLRNCGIGVAVANAIDEVKAVSDSICGTNDNDGVAKWIAENVL